MTIDEPKTPYEPTKHDKDWGVNMDELQEKLEKMQRNSKGGEVSDVIRVLHFLVHLSGLSIDSMCLRIIF